MRRARLNFPRAAAFVTCLFLSTGFQLPASDPKAKQAAKQTDRALENVTWMLSKTSLASNRTPEFRLHPSDRSVTGSTGCNTFYGNYRSNPKRLEFSKPGTTYAGCTSGVEDRAFLELVAATRTYRIQGNQLELMEAKGQVLATFTASLIEPGSLSATQFPLSLSTSQEIGALPTGP
ncbi:MAG: META domain-containing protein [Acidobacteriota bacterium]